MSDPGLALRATTLGEAMALLLPPPRPKVEGENRAPKGESIPPPRPSPKGEGENRAPKGESVPPPRPSPKGEGDSGAEVEEAAEAAGMRARRVILDGEWWTGSGMPMLARVAERRRAARPGDDAAHGVTGWVVLQPRALAGYRMLARDPETGGTVDWIVDAATAARLAPFAYTMHRLFDAKPLDTRDVLRFAWSHDRSAIATVVGAALLAALVGLLTPIATGHLIDRALPTGSLALAAQLVAGLFAAGLALLLLDAVRTLALLRFEARTGVAVQGAILERIIAAPAPFFRQFASGDLALRMSAVNQVQRTIAATTLGSFVVGIFLFANLGLMIAYSASLAAASMGLVAVAIAVPAVAGLARLKLGRRIEALDGQLSALTFETFAGIAKLRAAAAEPRAFANWFVRYDEFRALNRRSANLSNSETVAMSLLQPAAALTLYALAWHLGVGVTASHALSLGDFIAFQAALFALLLGVQGLVSTGMDLLRLKPVWERARPILEAVPEAVGARGMPHEPRGAISLEKVCFAYPGGPEVLHEVDLEVRPGEFVAIVGASGSGKSTLFRLLLGFEAPSSGQVRYDGHAVASLDLRRLRRGIGTVLQNGKLWPGDLFTNIAGASNADVAAAWEAARLAGIAADIEAMPMGIYTLVGEGLSTLSGGQRQRVLLARALVGKPRVLLLDEATSALDNVSQARVLEGLEALAATRIVIAHRLSTVRRADRVVVIDRGRIVQSGAPAELAAVPGPFAALLARQGA